MKISEKEIFDYVFYPENLTKDKVEYLKNSRLFNEEINFYHSLKKAMDEELSYEVKQKLGEKIPIYILQKVIVLYPVKEPTKKSKIHLPVLAAASEKQKPAVSVKTFIDESNHYLIRLLNFKDSAKIYVFSTTEEVLKNYQVVIKPSGQTFEQDDNLKPIEFKSPLEAENIELHLI